MKKRRSDVSMRDDKERVKNGSDAEIKVVKRSKVGRTTC